jgi:hypothetical protein
MWWWLVPILISIVIIIINRWFINQIENIGEGCIHRSLDQVIIRPKDIILLCTFDNTMISLRNRSIWNNVAYVTDDLKLSYYRYYGERVISRCVDIGDLSDFIDYARGNSMFVILYIYEHTSKDVDDLSKLRLSNNVRDWIDSINISKNYQCRDKIFLT